jgi:hypothetical protein
VGSEERNRLSDGVKRRRCVWHHHAGTGSDFENADLHGVRVAGASA